MVETESKPSSRADTVLCGVFPRIGTIVETRSKPDGVVQPRRDLVEDLYEDQH
jgi:hypothetical protein